MGVYALRAEIRLVPSALAMWRISCGALWVWKTVLDMYMPVRGVLHCMVLYLVTPAINLFGRTCASGVGQHLSQHVHNVACIVNIALE